MLDILASGMTENEIPRDYQYLEKADFSEVYAYASLVGRNICRVKHLFDANLSPKLVAVSLS